MLEKLTNWLREQILAIWNAFAAFMADLFLAWLSHALAVIVWTFDHLPVPDFLQGHSLGSMLAGAGPTVGWLITTFQIDKSSLVIATAMAFFIVRRVLTLGIW